jgi:hypothetical protein
MRLLLMLSAFLACSRPTPSPPQAQAPAGPEEHPVLKIPMDVGKPVPHAPPKREAVIGGCDDLCEEPRPAFEGFVRALFSDDSTKIIPFLETSLLVYNGQRKGDGWVEQWRRMEVKSRKESVLAFAAELQRACGKATDPGDVEESLKLGVRVKEISSTQVRVSYDHAAVASDDTASVWVFGLTQRGLEWLVSEIDLIQGGEAR